MPEVELQKIKIGVLGTWGYGNMGDAAVADATIDGLKRYFPNAEILGICQQPENSVLRNDITSVSIHREFIKTEDLVHEEIKQNKSTECEPQNLKSKLKSYLKRIRLLVLFVRAIQKLVAFTIQAPKEIVFSLKILRTVRGLNLMVMAGSGQLNEEWGGPWRFPFGLFRWCLLARICGCKVAFLSVGVGVLESFWARYFCSRAIRLSNYRSARDMQSKEIIETWNAGKVTLVPDMAFSIKFDNNELVSSGDGSLTVGINPIAYGDPRSWNEPNEEVYANYVKKLADFCNWLLSQGHRIVFVPNDLMMEKLTIDDIIEHLAEDYLGHPNILCPSVNNYEDVIGNLAKCDVVVCCRFHGLLFSLIANKPVIALAHHYKFFVLSEEMGQEKYCLDIDNFQTDDLNRFFTEIKKHQSSIVELIKIRREPYQELVENQYKKMIALVKS